MFRDRVQSGLLAGVYRTRASEVSKISRRLRILEKFVICDVETIVRMRICRVLEEMVKLEASELARFGLRERSVAFLEKLNRFLCNSGSSDWSGIKKRKRVSIAMPI